MLVVIDMVNGFVKEGALADKKIGRIVPNIIERINHAQECGEIIVFFRDCHKEDDPEFKTYPPHCIKGSEECEIIDELKPYVSRHNPDCAHKSIVIDKSTTNGFNTSAFQLLFAIESQEPTSVEITGCCSDICVRDFATSLLGDIKKKSLPVSVLIKEDCIDTFNAEGHDADEVNESVLSELEEKGAHIILADNHDITI